MAKKIVYIRDLTRREGSPTLFINNASGYVFVHDRTEIQDILDMDDLNASLAGVASFEVDGQSSPTFCGALEEAIFSIVVDKKDVSTIRDKYDNIVCFVLL